MTLPIASDAVHPPQLHDVAPDFRARTTMGMRSLSDYRGQWVLFFSHPADFTPVCTSEFVALARAAERFAALDCALLALSVDSLYSHLAWLRSIRVQFGVDIGFPIIEDPSMVIARSFGMVPPQAPDTALVRAVFVIDPIGIVRAILWYPMTTGRNVEELLRLVAALRTSDAHHVSTPANWVPGEDVILPAPQLAASLDEPGFAGEDWYYRTGPLPDARAPKAKPV
ncbi:MULTISPECIES: peroxiredoxin [Acidiphilium]|jgi:peroxiredoxin (alkyl hydroperoxide reductase subunit C)|uniref:Thioredoxin peroxidase n=1 Tax=Acidiphilium rubrum TaxID=526 RepID=A0A8G2CPD3_ACIRU|nr:MULTISPECIES: peroxiredoxin [Acidiphilium]SIR40651.1 1-Cys peroxiredoxin [Acidiphilium rubrum]